MVVILKRALEGRLRRALDQFAAVVLTGPRQVGKSTLALRMGGTSRRYITFDDMSALSSAREDPSGFIRSLHGQVTLDEIQRVPGLVLAVKREIDRDRKPGRFLLTGSATVGLRNGATETLAGRAAVFKLRPMTGAELAGNPEWSPLEIMFGVHEPGEILDHFSGTKRFSPRPDALLRGGFPEPALGLKGPERTEWFEQYRRTYIERDVPLLVSVAEVSSFMGFITLCAEETGKVLNLSSVSREVGIALDTARRWLGVLQATFLAEMLPAFGRSARKRMARHPKLHWTDTGLAAHLMGIHDAEEASRRNLTGPLTETRVYAHLASFLETLPYPCRLYHYRKHGGAEVDIIVEGKGKWIPVEVKAGATISKKHAAGLGSFLSEHPKKAPFGILLYGGDEALPLPGRVVALPIETFLTGAPRR